MGLQLWWQRYLSGHKCITSKSVLLALIWSISISLEFNSTLGGLLFSLITIEIKYKETYFVCVYAVNAITLCLYPLAGLLADNKFGRYKTIYQSSTFLLIFFILKGGIYAIVLIRFDYIDPDDSVIAFLVFISLMSLLIAVTFPLFNANIIQFGVDQLQDSPADHQSLFIYWYVWIKYVTVLIALAGSAIASCFDSFSISTIAQLAAPLSCSLVLLCIVLLIVHYKKHWFIIDTARSNPYKLVYRVTKFARQHKVPIRRSAFTYCEDDIPSGLDLGKSKYGGPFTTEQVEDVKAFYGILKILFSLGTVFFLDIVSGPLFTEFAHIPEDTINTHGDIKYLLWYIFLKKGLLSSSLIVIIVPIYIFFIRPFFYHNLNMLRRIGIGIVLFILSVVCTVVTGATIHRNNSTQIYYMDFDWVANDIDSYMGEAHHYRAMALVPQQCLSALSVIFIYPALYEFICAQSPHSMKGLFIGLSFAIKGLFEFLSSVLFFLFMSLRSHVYREAYYMVHLVVGVVGLTVYVYVARNYKLRERDEPCHVRRFVEDYYSKIPQEEHFNS